MGEIEHSGGAESIQACNPQANLCLKMQFVGHLFGRAASSTP